MLKKSLALAAIAASLFTSASHAAVFVDFEGSQNGALIGSFYSGGTDSFGNRGTNYGLSFNSGATVRVDNGRTYLANVTSVFSQNAFFEGATFLYSTFNSEGTSPSNADGSDISARVNFDPDRSNWTILPNTYRLTCDAYPNTYCTFAGGFAYVPDNVIGFALSFGGAFSAGSAGPLAIDSLTLGVRPVPFGTGRNLPTGSFIGDAATGEVPEPSTTVLLGLGLLGVLAAARRKA